MGRLQTFVEYRGPSETSVTVGVSGTHRRRSWRASILLFDPDGVMRFKAWRNLSDEWPVRATGRGARRRANLGGPNAPNDPNEPNNRPSRRRTARAAVAGSLID